MVHSLQLRWLFQQASCPNQPSSEGRPPNVSLTISKGGDASQVLSADLCNILHYKSLPGQLIKEVSCHKWCFTGEDNLLMETRWKGRSHFEASKKKKNLSL